MAAPAGRNPCAESYLDSDSQPRQFEGAKARAVQVGLAGYGCLLIGLSGGLLGGAALMFAAVSRIVRGSQTELSDSAEAVALSISLEGAVVAAGAGTLLLLIGVVCGVVLLKELADEATAKRRGPL